MQDRLAGGPLTQHPDLPGAAARPECTAINGLQHCELDLPERVLESHSASLGLDPLPGLAAVVQAVDHR
jgi:hypothetical protein